MVAVTETLIQFTSKKKVLERRHHQMDSGFPACIQQTEDPEGEEKEFVLSWKSL